MSGSRAERRYDRKAARRYMHMTSWRPCKIGLCPRCLWREVTGLNRRAKARHLIEARNVAAGLTPIRAWRDEDGRWHREAQR